MPRERRKWTEAEDAVLRDAVLKGGEGACDWHLIASCIPGRTNKDCRKRWHYKVAATVNKGPWEVAEDERLWGAVQEHGSRWALVSQVVKTRNGDQCSKRWYDALDPSIDHSPWTPEEDSRLLEAIGKHGRNWKAIVKAYFPRRTSLSAKNRYSLLIRKMEPKCKQSQSTTTRKASTRSLSGPPPQQMPPPRDGHLVSQFQERSARAEDSQSFHSNMSPAGSPHQALSALFGPGCRRYSATNMEHYAFGSPLVGQEATPDDTSYTPAPSECPTDWSGLTSANTATSEVGFPVTTPPGSNEDMSLFFNDLQLTHQLSQSDLASLANAKQQFLSQGKPPEPSAGPLLRFSDGRIDVGPSMAPGHDQDPTAASRVITVLINSEIPETVNSIVNQIGREAGVSIAIHLE